MYMSTCYMAFFDFFKQSCDFFWRGFDLVIFDTAPTGVLEHRWEKGPRDVGSSRSHVHV